MKVALRDAQNWRPFLIIFGESAKRETTGDIYILLFVIFSLNFPKLNVSNSNRRSVKQIRLSCEIYKNSRL